MSGGAAELAEIFGTEKDKVNCAFYFKIGACRHGDRCTRLHHKPTFSQSLILKNMYQSPYAGSMQAEYDNEGNVLIDAAAQEDFDRFYEDIYCEIQNNYGPIEELNVSGNLGDHLIGNLYIKMKYEEDAARLVESMNNRWYNGQPIYAELSPVTDFREACCRQFEVGECNRGGFCNFMHLKPISRALQEKLDRRFGRERNSRTRRSPVRYSRAINRDDDRRRDYDSYDRGSRSRR